VRKRMQSATHKKVNQTAALIMGGVTKIHVGELIENARVIMEEKGVTGQILPEYIREAKARLEKRGLVPYYKRKPLIRHR